VHAGRQLRLELRQQVLHGIGHRDRVGAGLALDAERDGALCSPPRVEPGRRVRILGAVDDRAERVEAHRRAVAVGTTMS
jgi:hypothetical protein